MNKGRKMWIIKKKEGEGKRIGHTVWDRCANNNQWIRERERENRQIRQLSNIEWSTEKKNTLELKEFNERTRVVTLDKSLILTSVWSSK
jgi:hypothetical protein